MAKLGKIDRATFDKAIYPRLGARRAEVLVPPQNGVDVGVVDLGDGRVLVVKTDPVYIAPQVGMRKAAWFAVHILASDVMTSGIPPQYAAIDLNLPPSIADEELEELWSGIHEALAEIGVAVVAGHTGRYEGVDYPMVGGFTMFGIGPRERLVTSRGARPGDDIVMTKGPAIEATALLANYFPEYFRARLPPDVFQEAYDLYWKMSCWRDGLIASRVGVHAMHDATEGGVWGALVEVAEASGVRIVVDEEKLFMPRAVKALTEAVGIDPWSAISEGTLIIATDRGQEVVEALRSEGIEAAVIGRAEAGAPGVALRRRGGGVDPIERPEKDPFWVAVSELSRAR
ncbi:MAG: AIR synthase family protein [Thermoproteus sp. AZ2]|jgi:hydrogenase maturation factor|uniref:AIR synthase family protein n=1 Tax=Thermoproteus sp. AZ2 TaxID=1609232 RepID=A0ACC6V1W1_9CREN